MSARAEVLITAAELTGLLDAGAPVTLLDVRWQLAEPDGRPAYERSHLPGAVYVSLEDELSDHAVAGRGRHPLPSGAALQEAARRWGVRDGVPVVVYGDVTVRHAELYAGARPTLDADAVTTAAVLLDARAPERFRGEVEPVDPVAGHIPGAVNVPSTSLLADDGTLLVDADLARRFGGTDVAVYCGSGVTAALVVAALTAAGVDAALFPGSWSEWCSDPTRPVARG